MLKSSMELIYNYESTNLACREYTANSTEITTGLCRNTQPSVLQRHILDKIMFICVKKT